MRLAEKQLLVVTIAGAGLIAVILAGMGLFMFRPKNTELREQITAVETETDQAKGQLKQKTQLELDVKQLEKAQKVAKGKFPTKDEMMYENFIDMMTTLSKDAKVKVLAANPVAESARSGPPGAAQPQMTLFEKISYTLQVEGDFFAIIKFISLLEDYQRFIKVDNFANITPKDMDKALKVGVPVTYGTTVKITTYVYNEK